MQDLNKMLKINAENEQFEKGEYNELRKKIKLKYGKGSIVWREKEQRYMATFYNKGKRHYLYDKNLQEIKLKLKNAIKNKDKIKDIENSLTLEQWLYQWFETYKKPFLALSSIKSIKTNIKNHIVPKIGHYKLNKLNSFIIQQALNNIDYPRQKEICYNILNASYNKAYQLKITKNDYMIAVEKQKAISKKGKAFTITEQKEFVKALNNNKYKNVFLSYLYTGCRLRELLSIRWNDVNFNDNLIIINGTKTANAKRTIPLTKKLKTIFKSIKQENEYIFNYKADVIDSNMKSICKSINLNDFTVHSLRHTFATRCIENNIPVKIVQKWLGHAKINITLDTYTHIQSDFEKQQSKKINDIF